MISKINILNSGKKVLITGGAGFIGSHFAHQFIQMGFQVYVIDNLSTGKLENLPISPNLKFYHYDIMDIPESNEFESMDLVIHLASTVGMKLAKQNPQKTFDTATKGTENVFDCTGNCPVVLISSSAVYGLTNADIQVSEKRDITIEDLKEYDGGVLGYACGKWEMEKIGLMRANLGRDVLIIRPFNVIGYRQVSEYGMVFPSFINAALENRPITVYGNGTQSRCFAYIDTFIEYSLKLIEEKASWKTGNNIINIGSNEITSIKSLAERIINATQSQSSIEYVPFHITYPGQVDVQGRVPDTSHCQNLIGEIKWPSMNENIETFINQIVIK